MNVSTSCESAEGKWTDTIGRNVSIFVEDNASTSASLSVFRKSRTVVNISRQHDREKKHKEDTKKNPLYFATFSRKKNTTMDHQKKGTKRTATHSDWPQVLKKLKEACPLYRQKQEESYK